MQRSPNIPPIIALPADTTAAEALRRDILDVLKDNRAYQLAALEQQDRLHDTLNELNRSLLVNREKLHADIGELSLQVDGLREDLNRFLVDPVRGAQHTTTGTGRQSSRRPRRPRRVQTPRPRRRSPYPATLDDDPLEADTSPDPYRYSGPPVPVRRSYTPAPTHPGVPSITTGTTEGSIRTRTRSNGLRPESRQQSSQGSSGLTYASDNPAMPPPPPGIFYPIQDPAHRQMSFPSPRAPSQQSPLHLTPVPPPPQMQLHRNRGFNSSQSD